MNTYDATAIDLDTNEVLLARVSPAHAPDFTRCLDWYLQGGQLTPAEDSAMRRTMRRRESDISDDRITAIHDQSLNGDHRACWVMGYVHMTGCCHSVFPMDAGRAEGFYRRAAETLPRAKFALSMMYIKGMVPGGFDEGVRLLQEAADAGHPTAANNLGRALRKGLYNQPMNIEQAVSYYRIAAEQGHLEAQFAMSVRYRYGQGVPRSIQDEVHWLKRCIEGGGARNDRVMTRFEQLYGMRPSPLIPFGRWEPTTQCHRWVPEFLDNAAKQVMLACRFRLRLPPYVALLIVSYVITE